MPDVRVLAFAVFAVLSFGNAIAEDSPTTPPSAPVAQIDGQPAIPDREVRQIRKDLRRALKEDLRTLEDAQKKSRRESLASRKQRLSEWKATEARKRHEFFASNKKGSDRRVFIKDFIERRRAFESALHDEEKREKDEQDVRHRSLEQDLADRLNEAEKYLKAGRRPPDALMRR